MSNAGWTKVGGYLRNQRLRQAGSLYAAMILTLIVGFVVSVINTRTLGPEGYGDLKFVNTVFQFLSVIGTLGLFTTGAQLLALYRAEDKTKYELIGALTIISLVISGALIAVSVLFSFLQPILFKNQLGNVTLIFSPIVGLLIFQASIEAMLQGDNRIHELALFRLAPGLLFMVSLVIVHYVFSLNVFITLLLLLATGVVIVLMYLKRLTPVYSNFPHHVRAIWQANKGYGWHVYIGTLSAVGTGYLSTFLISYYLDNTKVGFFSLAVTLTLPLSQINGVVGTTYFKEFAHSNFLPPKVTLLTILLSAGTLIVFVLLIKPIVSIAYTNKFLEVASLASIISTSAVLYGFGDYVNRFLGAHGQGKALRNVAILVGIVNVAGYSVLIKMFGLQGAAGTRILSGAMYCAAMLVYYRKFRKELLISQPVG